MKRTNLERFKEESREVRVAEGSGGGDVGKTRHMPRTGDQH